MFRVNSLFYTFRNQNKKTHFCDYAVRRGTTSTNEDTVIGNKKELLQAINAK